MSDQCREEFEKWISAEFPLIHVTGMKDDRYTFPWVANCWQSWQAAWKASPPLVTRDGWLTADEVDDIRVAMLNWRPVPPDVISKSLDMACAAISLHAERVSLVEKLRGVIKTIERGACDALR